jgi:hypothetical protein
VVRAIEAHCEHGGDLMPQLGGAKPKQARAARCTTRIHFGFGFGPGGAWSVLARS